jgi:hypothetical protein
MSTRLDLSALADREAALGAIVSFAEVATQDELASFVESLCLPVHRDVLDYVAWEFVSILLRCEQTDCFPMLERMCRATPSPRELLHPILQHFRYADPPRLASLLQIAVILLGRLSVSQYKAQSSCRLLIHTAKSVLSFPLAVPMDARAALATHLDRLLQHFTAPPSDGLPNGLGASAAVACVVLLAQACFLPEETTVARAPDVEHPPHVAAAAAAAEQQSHCSPHVFATLRAGLVGALQTLHVNFYAYMRTKDQPNLVDARAQPASASAATPVDDGEVDLHTLGNEDVLRERDVPDVLWGSFLHTLLTEEACSGLVPSVLRSVCLCVAIRLCT